MLCSLFVERELVLIGNVLIFAGACIWNWWWPISNRK